MTNIQQFGHKVQTKSIGNAETAIRLLTMGHLRDDEQDALVQFIGMQDVTEAKIEEGDTHLRESLECLDTHVSRLIGKALRSVFWKETVG